ncbi:MAG: uracil-DNA glycosylase [Anaerolineae bacterium]|nr:uracil-DNA glycosylase [Anaerolineae bacterium]
MPQDRAAALAEIAEEIKQCTKCALYKGTTNAVPGAGNIHAEIMFIGEGPGFHEDKQGLPFVGRSGDYLNYLLKLIGLDREQVFITNVVKHRPPENRDPLPDEIIACKPYLDKQIELIDPLVIATLGRFSMARYFPNGKISQIHGQPLYDDNRAYYPFFHPAAALRNPGLRSDMEADFKRLLEVIEKVREMRAGGSGPSGNGDSGGGPANDTPPEQLRLL